MIDRRKLLLGISAIPIFGVTLLKGLEQKPVIVSTPELNREGELYYKDRWKFYSEEEAKIFVKSLYPCLVALDLRSPIEVLNGTRFIRSGYRKAIGYVSPDNIVREYWVVRSKVDGKDYYPSEENDSHPWNEVDEVNYLLRMQNVASVWCWLEGIRVNGKPVTRLGAGGSVLPEYLTQPFIRANNIELRYNWKDIKIKD